jgi:hypothetical protein
MTTDTGQARGNVVLERLLARAGWAPENLGDRLNALAASLGLRARVHRRTPRRWIHPDPGRVAPRVPRDPWPSLVCVVLHERLGEPVTLGSLGWTATGALRYVAMCPLTMGWTSRGTPVGL